MLGFGRDVSEARLRELCDCTCEGTTALQAVDAARALGFQLSAKYTLSLEELKALVVNGHLPIVYVSLRPIDGKRGAHALVVLEMNAQMVSVYDPRQGERWIQRDTFSAAWRAQHNLTIIIKV